MEMASVAWWSGLGVCSITFSSLKSQWWKPNARCALSMPVSTCRQPRLVLLPVPDVGVHSPKTLLV